MSQKSTIRDQALYIAISLLMLVAFSLSGCASLQPPTPSLSPLHSPTAPAMLSPTTLPLPSPTTSPTAQSTPTAAVAPSATPVVPLPTGLIAYVGPDNQLRLMQADGSNQQALTTGETVVSPAWSPDGQTLAYISRQGPSGQAFLYSLSSQQAQPIGPVEDSNPHTLNWSADGLYLLLDSGTSVISTATIFDVATGQVAQQLQVELYAWSPTGHRLAFGREHPLATPLPIGAGNSIDLVVLDAAQGTELVVFEGSSTELYTPQGWLPDGRLLYDRFDWDPATQSGEDTLWTVTVDDTVGVPQPAADIPPQFDPAAVLARLPADLRDSVTGFFSWSPDDRWVLFQVQEGNQTVIYRFDWKTGGQPVRLADGSSAVWQPAPSPVTPASAEPPATPAPTVVFTVPVGPDGVQYGAEQTGPMALAAAADGTFWIADTQGHRLLHYDPQGALLNRIDLNGYGTGASDVEAIGSDVTVLLVGNGEQVLRFTADGNLLATYDVPKGLGPEGGLTGLATGDHGEILLEYESGAELVQLVDAQRVLHPAPLPGYTHEGRLFKALLADRLSSHGSIMVGSRRIEVTVPNILAGMRILGFTPAGDFYVTVDEMASTPTVWVDKTVRLYDRAGKLLGMARVPLAEWYTCVQNGLAVGTDGRICALLTYPDQVKVVRLGFSAELEPILPTPIAASMPAATVSPSPAERPATATSPSWRRLSWRRILFSYNHQGVAEVWTVDPAAGLARREIRPEQQIKDPAVSPEGETIAYICATGDYGGVPSELWLMDKDGANPRRLYVPPPGQGVLSQVAWQPDGQAIYFLQSGSGASNRLLRIPAGGGEPTAILSDCLDFALCPDSESLVAMSLRRQLDVFAYDGSHLRTLVPQDTSFSDYYSLAFSTDGRLLAFRGTEGGGEDTWNLYVMDADGTNVRRLTYLTGFSPFLSTSGQVNGLAWTADARYLVYSVDGHPTQMGIWRIGPDGGQPQRLFVWQEGEWAAVMGPWIEPAPASLASDADVQALLDDYARALSSGEVAHPAFYSPAMQDLIVDRRAFYQEFSRVADHSNLLGIGSRYTLESVAADAMEVDLVHIRAVEWLTMTARYRKPTPEEYTPTRAARWALDRTDDPAVQAALQHYIDTEMSGLKIGSPYETVWILRHHFLVRAEEGGLILVQDTYDDRANDNVDGTDVVDWAAGQFVRHKPDLTAWPDYALYHEPLDRVEELGQRLLEDYTRRYGSTPTPVLP